MFKKVTEDAILPTRGSKYSACVDLYARADITIGVGETVIVPLGVCISLEELFYHKFGWYKSEIKGWDNEDFILYKWEEFLKSHYLQLMIRSSLAVKGLILANGVGIIDLDFADEIKMIFHNPLFWSDHIIHNNEIGASKIQRAVCKDCNYIIKKGERIGQITLLRHESYLFGIESEDERNGGFGSTDKKENK